MATSKVGVIEWLAVIARCAPSAAWFCKTTVET